MSSMRALLVFGLLCVSQAFSWAEDPMPKVPRPAPELAITLPSGQQVLLSNYRGKVVILECLYTTCPHCMHEAQLLSKLQNEYGPRGLQVLGVAYNPMSGMYVPDFIKQNNVTFPVGSLDRDSVLNFLFQDTSAMAYVPQVAVIDKKGVIRDQTPVKSDVRFQNEAELRSMIEKYLTEPGGKGAPATTTKAPAATHAKVAKKS